MLRVCLWLASAHCLLPTCRVQKNDVEPCCHKQGSLMRVDRRQRLL